LAWKKGERAQERVVEHLFSLIFFGPFLYQDKKGQRE